eukprot:SAG31_NODE_529_length_14420_cov_20.000140_7_plen_140_part_00
MLNLVLLYIYFKKCVQGQGTVPVRISTSTKFSTYPEGQGIQNPRRVPVLNLNLVQLGSDHQSAQPVYYKFPSTAVGIPVKGSELTSGASDPDHAINQTVQLSITSNKSMIPKFIFLWVVKQIYTIPVINQDGTDATLPS